MPATVTLTGTTTVPRLKTLQQGSTGTSYGVSAMSGPANQGAGTNDMDSRSGLGKDLNFFQELQGFIAEMCRTCAMTPEAAIVHLEMMLHDMRRQPMMGERVYG
jgi:hypothetical protein